MLRDIKPLVRRAPNTEGENDIQVAGAGREECAQGHRACGAIGEERR